MLGMQNVCQEKAVSNERSQPKRGSLCVLQTPRPYECFQGPLGPISQCHVLDTSREMTGLNVCPVGVVFCFDLIFLYSLHWRVTYTFGDLVSYHHGGEHGSMRAGTGAAAESYIHMYL